MSQTKIQKAIENGFKESSEKDMIMIRWQKYVALFTGIMAVATVILAIALIIK